MTLAIVTDSTADVPSALAERYRIHVVPTVLVIQGQEYLDGEHISRREFYTRLPDINPPPTTAAPASGIFTSLYRRLLDESHTRILSLHLASGLSGVFNAAHLAAQDFGNAVTVLDSGQLSMGLGWQVLHAARRALDDAPLPRLLEELRDIQTRVRLVAMLDTLTYLRRSGRVSWTKAALGTLLSIRPFVEVRRGEVLRAGQTRTRRKGLRSLLERLYALGPLESLAILHTNAEAEARALLERYRGPVAQPPLIVQATPVIGVHVGPKGVGFAAVRAAA